MNFEKDAEEIEPTATVEDISGAISLRHEYVSLINDANAELKRLTEKLRFLEEERIPELFANAKVDRVDWEGSTVTVKEDIRVSIKKDDKEAAFDWFEANGHGGVIKSKVLMSFAELEDAKELIEYLSRGNYVAEVNREIHHVTLKALINEIHADGKHVDEDIISIYRYNKTTVKVKK